MKVTGFKPFGNGECHILILGSFPSVKSRETSFYYGHPQNRFWRTLAEFFGCASPATLQEKKDMLTRHGIALWDVVTECEIVGSSDLSIRDYTVADVAAFVREHDIRRILVNGKRAAGILLEAFPDLKEICRVLPSTSPANPRFDKELWFSALKDALSADAERHL